MAPKIPSLDKMTIQAFIDTFHAILEWKKSIGQKAYHDNPSYETLLEQSKFYGVQYANKSWGWASNIWSRSPAMTDVVEEDSQLTENHKLFLRSALEYVLAPNPLIKVDGAYGQNERVRFHCRLWGDARYPDLPLRWRELVFPADPNAKPHMEALFLCGMWCPATMPDGKTPLFVLRFPEHWFTVLMTSSYQGEWKKGALTHWIYYVFLQGGVGVHAGTKEFEVKTVDGRWRKIGMLVWGLTGSGKSTHSMWVFGEHNAAEFEKRGLPVLQWVRNQFIKNDDIVALFEDCALGSERGSWTKTEDVNESQLAIYQAGMSPRALHENTGMGPDGNPNFLDTVLHYRGAPNRNARTVMYLEDMKPYFNGSIDIDFPPNMAVFISPGFLVDYAWVKIEDVDFAAATLAAGRTVGHPAQAAELVGKERFVPLYNPFIIGKRARRADHVHRFHQFLINRRKRHEQTGEDPLECYLINTTGRVGTQYEWVNGVAQPVFEIKDGVKKPVGGTGPTIIETAIFLLQAARGAVKYQPHPLWGEKVLVPVEVPGIPKERLAQLNPFNHRSEDEMRRLTSQLVERVEAVFEEQIPGLDKRIARSYRF